MLGSPTHHPGVGRLASDVRDTQLDKHVEAFRHLLASVAKREIAGTREIVEWLEAGLDMALSQYAAAMRANAAKAAVSDEEANQSRGETLRPRRGRSRRATSFRLPSRRRPS
jgi:hypothetical protein